MSILGSSNAMGIQLSEWLENIVGKGEIAHYEQFLLFPQCFQRLSVTLMRQIEYMWSKGLIVLTFTGSHVAQW